MAQSRLEKIGTIFSRVSSLMKGGVMKPEEAPLWYSVYKAFPPKYEPRFDRPGSKAPIKDIYYTEDIIRAKFQEEFANVIDINMHSTQPTRTQQFITEYRKLEKEGVPESELYNQTKEKFLWLLDKVHEKKEFRDSRQARERQELRSIKQNTDTKKSNIDMRKIFG